MSVRLLVTLLAAVALTAGAQPAPSAAAAAAAQPPIVRDPVADSILEARTTALASQLRCPVCQGESIQDSPSSLAQEMRAVVKDQLASGKSPEEIKAYFVNRYGEWILLQPKAEGLNLMLYILPALVLIGGAAAILMAVRRWTSQPTPGEPQSL